MKPIEKVLLDDCVETTYSHYESLSDMMESGRINQRTVEEVIEGMGIIIDKLERINRGGL